VIIVGLTGFHGAGKSFLAETMRRKLGWTLVNKRDTLRKLYGKSQPADDLTWEEWYRVLYLKAGAFKVMSMILDDLKVIKSRKPIILDSIHNTDEWRAIKCTCPDALLVGVFSPKRVRSSRNNQQDEVLDAKRILYWHENVVEGLSCLLSEIEWAFSGCDTQAMQANRCYALKDYLKGR